MSGWGIGLLGYATTVAALRSLKIVLGTDAVYVVGTNVEYSVYVEFGTSRMPAQPYLRPAAQEVGRELDALAREHGTGDALVRAVALEIERRAKIHVPVDTGNLQGSIQTERVA